MMNNCPSSQWNQKFTSPFTTHADGNELELTGNRAGLLLLAKAALGMAETIREDGFHIHLDDLYGINAVGKSILIRKEEQSKP